MTVGELRDELDGIDPDLEVVAIEYGDHVNIEYVLLDATVIAGKVRVETGEQRIVAA